MRLNLEIVVPNPGAKVKNKSLTKKKALSTVMATSWPSNSLHSNPNGMGLDITSWNPNPGYESLVLQVQAASFSRKLIFHVIMSLVILNVVAFARPSVLCQRYRNTGFVLYEYSPSRICICLFVGILASWNAFDYFM